MTERVRCGSLIWIDILYEAGDLMSIDSFFQHVLLDDNKHKIYFCNNYSLFKSRCLQDTFLGDVLNTPFDSPLDLADVVVEPSVVINSHVFDSNVDLIDDVVDTFPVVVSPLKEEVIDDALSTPSPLESSTHLVSYPSPSLSIDVVSPLSVIEDDFDSNVIDHFIVDSLHVDIPPVVFKPKSSLFINMFLSTLGSPFNNACFIFFHLLNVFDVNAFVVVCDVVVLVLDVCVPVHVFHIMVYDDGG